ncbi:Uncharacterized membrane protein [Desemzia incerta]|uniref:Uncharacterized membrane protein n=1 Tax=Desemzia incerta TaxID=82801 RepID=A0A1I5UWE2_9LACT|nr:DUF979 domain-containing protein [Desemzia incerta]SFP99540.1 Uncharacterized membrane protein [Desemzia incerta]
MESTINNLLEFFFILTGFLLIYTAGSVFVDKTHPTRLGTTLFWLLLGVIFAIGNFIPYTLSGIMLLVIGALTLLKQVKLGHVRPVEEAEAEKASDRIGNWVFLPVVVLAAVAVGVAQFTELGGQVGIGIGAVVSLMTGILVTRATPKTVMDDSNRMIQQVGTTGILPQLLAALGVIFTAAGVGEVIAGGISTVLPEGNRFLGVVAYCLGMVIFTMIMGNAFAAFTVITAGIGVPFVIAQGGDPVIAGALAMTVGFCGTLLTPMAANFNALPAALLEMKSETGVIKEQTPLALIMIIVHIALMYFWAF